MDEAALNRTLSKIHRFTIFLVTAYLVAGIVVALASILGIAYLVVNTQWLPAIFILLARKDLVRWLDSESTRLIALNSKKG